MPNNNSPIAALRLIAIFTVTFLFYQGMRLGSRIEINVTIHKGESSNAKLRGDSRSPLISPVQHDDVDDSDAGGGLSSSSASQVSSAQLTIPMNIDDMIPDCAQDVFITLRHNDAKSSEPTPSSCRGMLIRDDIILTTRECSRDAFHFGQPVLSAVPHTILNNKDPSSRLGFLKVEDAIEHYFFIDQSYYRTRMFLSLKSATTTVTVDDGKDVAVFTCDVDDENKPIVHNFPAKGGREMIPIHELYGVVPDDILWEHTDLYTAPTLKFKQA